MTQKFRQISDLSSTGYMLPEMMNSRAMLGMAGIVLGGAGIVYSNRLIGQGQMLGWALVLVSIPVLLYAFRWFASSFRATPLFACDGRGVLIRYGDDKYVFEPWSHVHNYSLDVSVEYRSHLLMLDISIEDPDIRQNLVKAYGIEGTKNRPPAIGVWLAFPFSSGFPQRQMELIRKQARLSGRMV